MEQKELLHHVDHTLLKPEATWAEAKATCDEAIQAQAASVCLSPCYVGLARQYVRNAISVTSVIAFPHGNQKSVIKGLEAKAAIQDGVSEIDMVLSLGMVKEKNWGTLFDELANMRKICEEITLKVIVEACLLTQDEKQKLCAIVSAAGADYLKTSTGFSTGGATLEDVTFFRAHLPPQVRIKAAGGIRTFEQAKAFLDAGADRIGSSALVKTWLAEQNKE